MPSVVTTHAFLIREKALHTASVNQEEDSPLFFLIFFGAMCRALPYIFNCRYYSNDPYASLVRASRQAT